MTDAALSYCLEHGRYHAAGQPCPCCPLDVSDEDEPVYFCPHGVEVPTSGGACDRCATEDARDDDGPFGDTLGGWGI